MTELTDSEKERVVKELKKMAKDWDETPRCPKEGSGGYGTYGSSSSLFGWVLIMTLLITILIRQSV